MEPKDVVCWLEARQRNCLRIAKEKHGKDRDGWIEGARYFQAAISLLALPTHSAKAVIEAGKAMKRGVHDINVRGHYCTICFQEHPTDYTQITHRGDCPVLAWNAAIDAFEKRGE